MALVKCKECGQQLSKKAKECPKCGAPQGPKQIGCGSVIVLGIVGLIALSAAYDDGPTNASSSSSRSGSGGTTTSGGVASRDEQRPKLEVLSFRCEKEHGFVYVRGEVRNISPRKLQNVTAVGNFRNAQGALVKTETALVEYNPLMPGQTSPYQAGGTGNPQITNCSVGFKHLMGGAIDYISQEDREKERREKVEGVQQRLNEMGYSAGPVDGVLGPQTRDAIKEYQTANGLAPDGEITSTLMSHLRQSSKQ